MILNLYNFTSFSQSQSEAESATSVRAVYVIDSVGQSDEGSYMCRAQNSAGQIEDLVQIIVQDDGYERPAGGQRPSTSGSTIGGNLIYTEATIIFFT